MSDTELTMSMCASSADYWRQTAERLKRDWAESVALCAEQAKEVERLRAEYAKSERRAIVFGDIVHNQVVAMQAAVLEGHLSTPAKGLQWIVNTLAGPGHLPDLEEARALGGAQAYWDRETAKHEEFRAAHPGPDLARTPPTAPTELQVP
jgi:hypothetical protein